MHKTFLHFVLFTIFIYSISQACTTVLVSGKYTKNKNPLIFKHRDPDTLKNLITYFEDGKYNYMGVVNSFDKERKEIWMDTNSVGFCKMNSVSYNLKNEDEIFSMTKNCICGEKLV